MDNLSHTLVGLAVGELITRTTRPEPEGLPPATRRICLLLIGMIGSNLPDCDLLWSMSGPNGDNLAYLLEHRGYTHTLVGCAVLAVLLWLGSVLSLRWSGLHANTRERWLLAATALISVFLHLAMDALNSYGVHPFWPWNNRWYYGDAVFIVEPLYWLAAAPLLLVLQSLTARLLLGLSLLIASLAQLFLHGFAWQWWLVALLPLALVWVGHKVTPRLAALTSCLLMLLVSLGFLFTSMAASSRVQELAQQQFPGYHTLDTVLSPTLVQPQCWDVLLLQQKQDDYAVRRGQLSMAATGSTAGACSQPLGGRGIAPLSAVAAPDANGMHWTGEFSMSAKLLGQLARIDCHARELMQFVRAPFAAATPDGWILGDMRFDRDGGLGMGKILIAPGLSPVCSFNVPWLPPRLDLLSDQEPH